MTAGTPSASGPDLYGTGAPVPADDVRRVDDEPRCEGCGRMLAERLTRPWRIRCPRCKRTVTAGVFPDERPPAQ